MVAVPSVGSRGKAYGGGLRERSPPQNLITHTFTGKSQDFNEMKLMYYSRHIFYLKNQLYYRFLLFTNRVIGLCLVLREGGSTGSCLTHPA